MALFVLLAASAGAGLIPAHFLFHPYRLCLLLASLTSGQVTAASVQLTHINSFLFGAALDLVGITYRQPCLAKERNDVFIDLLDHPLKQFK